MTDFAKQVIVDSFASLPQQMQQRVLRMIGIESIDLIDSVDPRRLNMVARQVTSYLLRPTRPDRPNTPTA